MPGSKVENTMRRDAGLLLLRVGIGLMFVGHGWPKLSGGPDSWRKLGGALTAFGIDFAPAAWGLAAALAEGLGGVLIATGVLFRPAAAAMLATMVVAATMHLARGDGFIRSSHAIEAGFVFAAFLLTGPGAHALGSRLR